MLEKIGVILADFYRKGVEWIALNDEPSELDQETVSNQISTLLLADLFGVHEIAVAEDIIEERFRGELVTV